jgi:hypothetical protein
MRARSQANGSRIHTANENGFGSVAGKTFAGLPELASQIA